MGRKGSQGNLPISMGPKGPHFGERHILGSRREIAYQPLRRPDSRSCRRGQGSYAERVMGYFRPVACFPGRLLFTRDWG